MKKNYCMCACSRGISLKRRKCICFFFSLSSLGFLAIVSWVVKFEWILGRHANQSSSSFAYSSSLNFLPQARTHLGTRRAMALSSLQSFTLSCRSSVSTNCDNGFSVSVLGSRGSHRVLWPSLRNSCSTKLLCAKSNSEGGVSTSTPAMEEQSPPIISLRFIGVSEKNVCTTLNWRKMFSQQKSLFAQCPPSDFFSNAL